MEDVPSRSAVPRRTKRGRLSRSAEFERVYRQGRSHGSRHFILHAFPRERAEGGEPRLGVSVSRKVGGAVRGDAARPVAPRPRAGRR